MQKGGLGEGWFSIRKMLRSGILMVASLLLAMGPAYGAYYSGVKATTQSMVVYGAALTVNGGLPVAGTELAVFDQAGNIAGASAQVDPNTGWFSITVYADDSTSPGIDEGMSANEELVFEFYDPSVPGIQRSPNLVITPSTQFPTNPPTTVPVLFLDNTQASIAVDATIVANDPPEAYDDATTVDEDSSVSGTLTGADPSEGDPITFLKVTDPANGSVTLATDGGYTYTPDADFDGTDTFTFKVNDGYGDSNVATVTVTVNPFNDAPTATDASIGTDEDTTSPGVTPNVNDVDSGDVFSFAIVTQPTNGTASVVAGKLVYAPNGDFNGSDTFTYSATDSGALSVTGTATVDVAAVNDLPTADPATTSVNEDTPLNGTLTGTDVDLDALTFRQEIGPIHGSVTVNADGNYTYTPSLNYYGDDSFTFVANDNSGDSAPATVNITVNPVNDLPVAASATPSVAEDNPLTGTLTASDVDDVTLTYAKVTDPASGSVTVTSGGSYTYTPNQHFNGSDSFTFVANDGKVDSAAATISIAVTPVNDDPTAASVAITTNEDNVSTGVTPDVTDVDTDDTFTFTIATQPTNGTASVVAGQLVYSPTADLNGNDTFTFTATDSGGAAVTGTATVTVNPVNDAPVADNVASSVSEDNPLSGTLTASDVDDVTLTFAKVTDPTYGSVTVAAGGSYTYTPNAHFNGSDSFTFVANDGKVDSALETVTITVDPVNDAPTAASATITTDEDNVSTGVTPDVTDVDTGDTFTYVIATQPANGFASVVAGQLVYSPTADLNGSDTFTFTATDSGGELVTGTATVTVNPVNDAPVADSAAPSVAEDNLLTGTLTATDVDDVTLNYAKVTDPTFGSVTVAAGGSYTYTPNEHFYGGDTFTFVANDGKADSAPATVSITITAVNDAPTLGGTPPTTSIQDSFYSFTPVGADVENDDLTYDIVNKPTWATFDTSTGQLSGTPGATDVYNDVNGIVISVSDGAASTELTPFNLLVLDKNDPPNSTSATITTNEDTPSVGVDPVVDDPDPIDNHTFTIETQPSSGTAAVVSNQLVYTPNGDYNGSDSFTFRVSDQEGLTVVGTASVTVNAVNDAPTAASADITTNEDNASTGVTPVVTDVDLDDTFTFAIATQPTNGTASVVAGQLFYSPTADLNGSDTFTFTATDSGGEVVTGTATVSVNAVNDAPTSVSADITTDEDTDSVGVTPVVADVDLDDTFTFAIATQPSNGAASVVAGQLVYSPTADLNGSDTFTFTATDSGGEVVTGTATVTVNAVNDAPASASADITTDEDTDSAGVTPVVADVDLGDTFTFAIATQPTNGTASVVAGQLFYSPTADLNGSDTFTFTATDSGGEVVTGTATVEVAAVNDAPTSVSADITTDEDTDSVGVTPVVADVDLDDTFTFAIATQPNNGAASVVAGQLVYSPTADLNGSDTFTFTATDSGGEVVAGTATVTVNAVNDAPASASADITTDEDIESAGVTPVVADVDLGDTFTFSIATQPANGTASVVAGQLVYSPTADLNGSDTFTFTATDSGGGVVAGTATVFVNAVNDAPTAASADITTDEDSASAGVTPVVTDVDLDDTFTFAVATQPSNGAASVVAGQLVYTPAADLNGNDTFTFTATDSGGEVVAGTATVFVNAVNDAPVANADSVQTDEDVILTGDLSGSDIDGDDLNYVLASDPAIGSVTVGATGSYTYSPYDNLFGTDSFTFVANDGELDSDPVTVTVTVNSINDKPTITAVPNQRVRLGQSTGTHDFIVSDVEDDPATLTVTQASGDIILLPNGNIVILPVAANARNVEVTPSADQGGQTTVTLTVTDADGGSSSVSFDLNVVLAITATAEIGGSVTPAGETEVDKGGMQTYQIIPDADYFIDEVLVDGVPQGAIDSYTFTAGDADMTLSASFMQIPVGININTTDTGLPGLHREDGQADGDNLEAGKPVADAEYTFSVTVKDYSGAPPAKVVLNLDGHSYDMTLTEGQIATGATYSYTTKLGPAPGHDYSFEAQDDQGNPVFTYPAIGTQAGPVVELLNGANMVGVPRDLSGVSLDAVTALGSAPAYRWVSGGLSTGSHAGSYVGVDAGAPVAGGEGYFVLRSAATLPDVDSLGAVELVTDSYEMVLEPGWNMISNPYGANVLLADILVKRDAEDAVSWSEATASRWLTNAIYSYSGSDWGSTYGFESAGGLPEAKMVPWQGYWVYVARDNAAFTLVIPKP